MSLENFSGRWIEVESKNDSAFYSEMGLGAIKKFIFMKFAKRDLEIIVKNEKVYEYIEQKFRHREEVTLGVEHFRTTVMGKVKALANLEQNVLVIKLEIVETNNSMFGIKLQPGTTIRVNMEVNALEGKINYQMILNGVAIEKVLKKQ